MGASLACPKGKLLRQLILCMLMTGAEASALPRRPWAHGQPMLSRPVNEFVYRNRVVSGPNAERKSRAGRLETSASQSVVCCGVVRHHQTITCSARFHAMLLDASAPELRSTHDKSDIRLHPRSSSVLIYPARIHSSRTQRKRVKAVEAYYSYLGSDDMCT